MKETETRSLCGEYGEPLHLPSPGQVFVRVTDGDKLLELAKALRERLFYLVALVGTDERNLLDDGYKLTYLFSDPNDDVFVFIEKPLEVIEEPFGETSPVTNYASLAGVFPAADSFERELSDLLGLFPRDDRGGRRDIGGDWLHRECYPLDLYPLRRDLSAGSLRARFEAYAGTPEQIPDPPDGEWLLPVGPIHAGVIEPSRFLFRLAGETVEDVAIRLGYTHRGIERQFQTAFNLDNGWQLAEHVSGDSAFAHSLAYCRAAEALARKMPPDEAELLRGLFLELERLANHIGNCAAIVHDVAYGVVAAELAALREDVVALCGRLAGHRFLRRLNRPGGIILPAPLDVGDVRSVLSRVAAGFQRKAEHLIQLPEFRARLQWTGILTKEQALRLGITGLAARASGVRRDFRLQHPVGIYSKQEWGFTELVQASLPPEGDSPLDREATAGDAFARFLARTREVSSSARIIERILDHWEQLEPAVRRERSFVRPVHFRSEHNYEFGLGHAEGWRGDVVYWLMQDKFGRIFRCQARDPSILNWPGLKAAVDQHELDQTYRSKHRQAPARAEIIVADFPIVNMSFSLSIAGNDR